MKVLVTDGENRAALAITRSLGRAGHDVIVAERHQPTLAGSSRHCRKTVLYPDPVTQSDAFAATVLEHVRRERVDVVMPVADITTFLVNQHRDELEAHCRVPLAPPSTVDKAADKVAILNIADRLGVPVPRSIAVATRDGVDADALAYPVVVKPHRSRVRTQAGWASTSVSYAEDAGRLRRDLAGRPDHEFPVLLQERIEGPGVGVFACYHQGRAIALFGHKRLRERPPWGGVSVLSESVLPDAAALDSATRLLDAIAWQGVAMVEFKRDHRDGQARLMEINGRFWGSLQLAIDAGVDFPLLLLRSVQGEVFGPQPPYRVGVRSRWLWGDIDALLLTLFARSRVPGTRLPSRPRALWNFVRPDLHARLENPRLSDLGPWLHETSQRLRGFDHRSALGRSAAATATADATPTGARPVGQGPVKTASGVRAASTIADLGVNDDEWRWLASVSETNTVFQTRPWVESWSRVFATDSKPFFVAVPALKGQGLAGLAAFIFERRFSGERVVRFLADARADYCDVLAAAGDKPYVLRAVLDELDRDGRWDVMELTNIPDASHTVETLRTICAEAGYRTLVDEQGACPTLLITGRDDAREILGRPSLRRRVNYFTRHGTLRCLHLTRPADIAPYLDRFVSQHIARWAGHDTPSLFNDARNITFYRELTDRVGATGAIVFSVVELNGEPIAFHFGFDYNGAMVWYKPSFDVQHARHSPGLVMLHFLVARAVAEGRAELDFTIGDEAFKKRFTNYTRVTRRVRVFKNVLRYNLHRSRDAVRSAAKSIPRP